MVLPRTKRAVDGGDTGVGVGAEEVVVVVEEVGADDEGVVSDPRDGRESCGRKAEAQKRADAVSGAGPEDPGDGGKEEDGGGLGKDHEGEKQVRERR